MATLATTLARRLAQAAALTRAPVGRPCVSAWAAGAAHMTAHARTAALPGAAKVEATDAAMAAPAGGTAAAAGGGAVAAAASGGGRALKDMPASTSSISDFVAERDTKFYVDKAAFLPALERAGRVVALLRPQRWGKTVFLNMLDAYYDCARAAAPLVRVPGGDTGDAHKFTILRFDLLGIASAADGATSDDGKIVAIRAALDALVVRAVKDFVARYNVPAGTLTAPTSPMDCLKDIGAWAAKRGTPVYVLVDEYDAPLRHAAIHSGTHAVVPLARGPLRAFYGRFKELAGGGFVSRMFLTGISPLGFEVMTTAFNIVKDVSQEPELNGAVGFSRADVSRAIVECTGYDEGTAEHAAIVATLTKWGNGYLFAPELTAESGMYQSVMVVQLLDAAKKRSREHLLGFLAHWVPSVPLQAEPDRALMDYYAPSAAMGPLLLRLTVPRASVPAPPTLNALTVADQAAAAVTQDTILRTLFYEGLLTHAAVAAGAGYAAPQLRVPNDNMQRRFFGRFVEHLRKKAGAVRAAEAFIASGKCDALERVMASVCRPGLLPQAIRGWYEVHVSQRLALVLMTAEVTTNYRWVLEAPFLRVGAERVVDGRADVYGSSPDGTRYIFIEAKQINVAYDIEGYSDALVDVKRSAEALGRMDESNLLALRLKASSVKYSKGGARTAGDVVEAAKVQVGEYASGWLRAYADTPGAVLDTYVAVAFGPLRWLIQPVARYEVPAADSSPVAIAAAAGAAAPTGAAAQLK